LDETASADILIEYVQLFFAVGDGKKKGWVGFGRVGNVHKVTRRYISVICGAGARADSHKIWHATCTPQHNQYVQFL